MRGTRLGSVGIAGAALLLALTGCSVTAATPIARHIASSSAPTHTASKSRSEPVADPEPTLSGIVATGTLSSTDGATSGTVVLTAEGGDVTATIDDFTTAATGQLDLELSPHPATAACPADSWSFVMNAVDAEPHTWDLPTNIEGGPFQVDPSYLRSAVLRVDAAQPAAGSNGCAAPVLAVASLTWKTAPTHQGLAAVDHGSRQHATGTAASANGTLSTYTVAPNDTIEAICARFGLTEDDFAYLNPFDADDSDTTLRYGTVFNLDAANRGAPPA
jgi:hypothetical protein